MTSQQAQSVAQELGDILPNDEKLQAEIHRLNFSRQSLPSMYP
ncbi:hypothetical protein [Dolichospermum flos-aquae]|nr:hypothetical protein [Dolichospermum flos-aquae]